MSTFNLPYPTDLKTVHNRADPNERATLLTVNLFMELCAKNGDVVGVGFPVNRDLINMDYPLLTESPIDVPYDCTHVLWFPDI